MTGVVGVAGIVWDLIIEKMLYLHSALGIAFVIFGNFQL